MGPDIDEIRTFSEPVPDRPPIRNNRVFRFLTRGVMVLSAAWIIAINLLQMHPSKLTLTGVLLALIFYAGESIGWRKPPRTQKTRRRGRHEEWTSR